MIIIKKEKTSYEGCLKINKMNFLILFFDLKNYVVSIVSFYMKYCYKIMITI